jgi:hypothetical protein
MLGIARVTDHHRDECQERGSEGEEKWHKGRATALLIQFYRDSSNTIIQLSFPNPTSPTGTNILPIQTPRSL